MLVYYAYLGQKNFSICYVFFLAEDIYILISLTLENSHIVFEAFLKCGHNVQLHNYSLRNVLTAFVSKCC